jgi:hypothetical protein
MMILISGWGAAKTVAGSDGRVLVGKSIVLAKKLEPYVHQDTMGCSLQRLSIYVIKIKWFWCKFKKIKRFL